MFISIETGIDGGKKINGRKRHLAVDALELPLALHVSAANCQDGQQGIELLWQLEKASQRLELIRTGSPRLTMLMKDTLCSVLTTIIGR